MKAQMGVDVETWFSLNLGARWGWVWVTNDTHRPLSHRQSEPVPTVQETGCDSEPVWSGVENLLPNGV